MATGDIKIMEIADEMKRKKKSFNTLREKERKKLR
jgi:hypothetical protein